MVPVPDATPASATTNGGYDGAYIAHLWEQPNLCVAIFGVQFHTPKGFQRYGASGITEEMFPALEAAKSEGFLHQEVYQTEQSGTLLQYWRSYEDLDRWARKLPHMRWWRWLLENAGDDLSFYHEIYQVKKAEAIFEKGCRPVGAAMFTTTSPVSAGQGQSRQRQERFAEAAAAGE
jgi:heme-degrading monooxygenase HmoA